MADFQLKVTAETQGAEKDLQRLDKTATEATKDRKIKIDVPSIGEVSKSFSSLGKDISAAANDIKKFYGVAKQLPGIGDKIKVYENAVASTAKTTSTLANNTKAGEIIAHSFGKATSAVGTLVDNLAKVGFALFGIKEIVGVLQTAFGGFFNETIGREIKLRETILKTQTTLASTNKVFRNGKEITDPYQKIVALTGEVAKRIDSIRERSIALAGVTSNDVIEVFGMVASQVGQIGGGLKEAEDLAINFAAALGTFGIPLYQARQEIGSILRADITTDSYLAKALGITNEDVTRAKTQAGGVVKFLEERLAAAVAGQKIAAQGFSGVLSNIRDLYELVSQRFGAALLDPLLNGLTAVFEGLFKIKDQLFRIAQIAGAAFSRVAAIGGELANRTGGGLKQDDSKKALNNVTDAVQDVVVLVETAAQRAVGALAQAINTLKPSVITVVDAFIRLGRVFIEIKVDIFESLARTLANLISLAVPLLATFTTLFNLYSKFLDLPVVKEFAKLAATMSLLKKAGMDFIFNLALVGTTIVRVIIPAVGAMGAALGVVVGGVGAVVLAIGKLTVSLAGLTASLAGVPGIAVGVAQALLSVSKNLSSAGQDSVKTGNNINTLSGGFKNLGETAKLAGLNIIKSLGWTLLIQAAITVVVNAFGEYQKASEDAARQQRAVTALKELGTTYRNVGNDADFATRAARDFRQQLADAEYGRAVERLEEIRKKLNDLKYEAQFGFQTWGEFLKSFDLGRLVQRARGLNPTAAETGRLLGEEAKLREYNRKYEAQQNKKDLQERIDLEAQNKVNLEKEITDLQRQHQDELFQQRQTLAQKEVEIFTAAGELRIQQMERANKKLLEGQEGESRAALEALNNYLSVRERGELEIEAAKQNLAVEVANMEKAVSNYRLEIEKKIFDLRKRSGENEIAAAKARDQLTQQQLGGPVPADVAGRQEKAMQFFLGKGLPTVSAAALVGGLTQESAGMQSGAVNPTSKAEGLAQWLGSRKDAMIASGARNSFNKQLEFIWSELQGSESKALEMLRNAKTLNQAHLAAAQYERFDGYQAIGSGTEWGSRIGYTNAILNRGQRRGQTTGATAGGTPQLQGRSDLGNGKKEAEEYAAAVSAVSSAMERLRVLQAALTNAKTKEAFEAIAQSVFQPVGLEQYQDQLNEVQLTYEAIASSSTAALNPEAAKIAIDGLVKQKAAARELKQVLDLIDTSTLLNGKEKGALQTEITKRHEDYVKSLRDEEAALRTIQAIRSGNEAIQQLQRDTADMYKELEVTKLQNRLEAEGVSPERIAAEVAKLRLKQYLTEKQQELNTALETEKKLRDELAARMATATDQEKKDLQQKLQDALNHIKTLEAQLKQLPADGQKKADAIDATAKEKQDPVEALFGRWKAELKDTRQMIADMAQTIQTELSSAMSSAIMGVIDGTTTIGDAFAQMFKNIGKAFIDMATQMIAKMLVMYVFNTLLGGLLGGSGGGSFQSKSNTYGSNAFGGSFKGTGASTFGPGAISVPGYASGGYLLGGFQAFAEGGMVSQPTFGVVGEGGEPEYVIPQSKMLSAMKRYANGQRGPAVLESGADTTGAMGGAAATYQPIDVRYNVEKINNIEYVTAEQFQAGMRQAAAQGAQRGEQRALRSLQQSTAVRSRVGMR